MRTRKRKREITWPNKEQKSAKIIKLDEVIGVVVERKEVIRKKMAVLKEKAEKESGMFGDGF